MNWGSRSLQVMFQQGAWSSSGRHDRDEGKSTYRNVGSVLGPNQLCS